MCVPMCVEYVCVCSCVSAGACIMEGAVCVCVCACLSEVCVGGRGVDV